MGHEPLQQFSKSMAVTPADGSDLSDSGATVKCRGISVTVAGVIAYKDADGTSRLTGALAVNTIHNLSTKRILSTGTTATGIVAYW